MVHHNPIHILEYYKEPSSDRDLYLIIMTLFACEPDKLFAIADFKHGDTSSLENYSWRKYGILITMKKRKKDVQINVILDGRNL